MGVVKTHNGNLFVLAETKHKHDDVFYLFFRKQKVISTHNGMET
jgi:hypothetical protein